MNIFVTIVLFWCINIQLMSIIFLLLKKLNVQDFKMTIL